MKKKSQLFKNLKTKEELNQFLLANKDKVIVLNVYESFWGACEVAEPLIKRFQDDPATTVKSEWVSIEKSIGNELIPQQDFGSKPSFHLFVVSHYIPLYNIKSIER